MFDFAINKVGIPSDRFTFYFTASLYAKEIARGNPKYVAGHTGPEIARMVIEKTGYAGNIPEDVMYADRSPEYWAGWAIAFISGTHPTIFHISLGRFRSQKS